MACEKEEHLVNKNNEQLPQNPKDMVQNKFIFQWDTLIDDSKNDDEFFIGNQYIGVQRWECLATSPHIYVGATFPKSSFATTFDRENIDKKHPIDLTFNFPIPYITCMEDVKGSEYLQKIKEKVCRNTRCAFFFFIDYKNRLIFLSCDILRISLIYAFSTSK